MKQVIPIAEIPDRLDQNGRLTSSRSSAKRMGAGFSSNRIVLV
ncbi:hypothetical protein ACQ4M3_05420 [Leptolyngbya sp. AN03gr2]